MICHKLADSSGASGGKSIRSGAAGSMAACTVDVMPQSAPSGVEVLYDESARRFEAHVEGSADVAYIDVVPGTNLWSLVHTEVPASFRGQGIGSALVRGALAYVRARGANVKPICPFVVAYLREHPEEADLVLPRHRHLIE